MAIQFRGDLSQNFTQAEYHKAGGTVYMQKETVTFIKAIQRFRSWLRKPMIVVSWMRTRQENERVGGIPTSNHLTGTAMDWKLSSGKMDEKTFIAYAKKWHEVCLHIGCLGEAGLYNGWVHFGMQNPTQAKVNNRYFFAWDSRSGKQINNPWPELRGLKG